MRAIYKIHIVEQVSKHPRQKKHIGAKICLIHVTKAFETTQIKTYSKVPHAQTRPTAGRRIWLLAHSKGLHEGSPEVWGWGCATLVKHASEQNVENCKSAPMWVHFGTVDFFRLPERMFPLLLVRVVWYRTIVLKIYRLPMPLILRYLESFQQISRQIWCLLQLPSWCPMLN